jgi:hypothetical protein
MENDRLLPARQVCARYGIVERTLTRWLDSPISEFPAPVVINGRRYFSAAALNAFDKRMTRAAGARGAA